MNEPEEMFGVGWVAADVIHNVFTEAKTVLEDRIWPRGSSPDRRDILQFLDAIRARIYQRAATTRQRTPPAQTAPARSAPAAAPSASGDTSETPPQVDSRTDYLAHAARARGMRQTLAE